MRSPALHLVAVSGLIGESINARVPVRAVHPRAVHICIITNEDARGQILLNAQQRGVRADAMLAETAKLQYGTNPDTSHHHPGNDGCVRDIFGG